MKQLKNNWESKLSTAMGIIVSIANAWITIDWVTFELEKEYPKLVLSALIAIGGFKTKYIRNGNK